MALERKLADQAIGRLLVVANLTEGNYSWAGGSFVSVHGLRCALGIATSLCLFWNIMEHVCPRHARHTNKLGGCADW